MTPERRDRRQGDVRDEPCLVACVAERKVQVRLRRHVEQRSLDRCESPFEAPVKPLRGAYIVALPCAGLKNQIVGVGAPWEVLPKIGHEGLQRGPRWPDPAPELLAPPFLREEPACPDKTEQVESPLWLDGVMSAPECRIQLDRRDLGLEPNHAVGPALCGARRRHDAV